MAKEDAPQKLAGQLSYLFTQIKATEEKISNADKFLTKLRVDERATKRKNAELFNKLQKQLNEDWRDTKKRTTLLSDMARCWTNFRGPAYESITNGKNVIKVGKSHELDKATGILYCRPSPKKKLRMEEWDFRNKAMFVPSV
jgi:hypothetical protein